jgi:hypothetical protein
MGCGHRSAQLCVHEIPKTSENVTAQIERSNLTFVPVERALIAHRAWAAGWRIFLRAARAAKSPESQRLADPIKSRETAGWINDRLQAPTLGRLMVASFHDELASLA